MGYWGHAVIFIKILSTKYYIDITWKTPNNMFMSHLKKYLFGGEFTRQKFKH